MHKPFQHWHSAHPHIFLLALIVLAALVLMPWNTWLVLTLSGLAMGAMVFLMASGMSLTFGLMNVLNLAHGAFISLGAFVGASVLLYLLPAWALDASLAANLVALAAALLLAAAVAAGVGLLFERVVIRPVYGDHLKQILVTVGGSIVLFELIEVVWGHLAIPLARPEALRGALVVGGIALEKYRVLAVVLVLALYAAMLWVIERRPLGILIPAVSVQ